MTVQGEMEKTTTPTTAATDAAHRDAVRARLVGSIPWWYVPAVHLAAPTLFGIAITVVCVLSIANLHPAELLIVPFMLVLSNMTEWRAHKYLLHRRTRFFEVLFDRHTPEHHVVYIEEDMAMRSAKEFRLVLIPAFGIVAIFIATSPITAALYFLGFTNLAALFVMSAMFYVLSYEWLHLSYHLPADSFIGRRSIIRKLRRHHATHHRPELMQKWNFNVNVPLWDWVRGTIWKG